MGREFYITDVFCDGPYSGNPLATVTDCEGLDTLQMQKIARQFNFSETTFFLGGNRVDGYDVRIFTPTEELPFAGHPTLGTAYLINEQIESVAGASLTLNLRVGKIPVQFNADGILWMKQKTPVFGETVSIEKVSETLGLSVADINPNFPAQFVSTGLEFLIVPLNSLAALKRSVVNKVLGMGMLIFSREAYSSQHDLSARVFARGVGVDEDPATGSANGDLASYLVEHEFFGSHKIALKVGQGYEIQRPSTLHLKAEKSLSDQSEGRFDINVGGRVRLVAKGELFV